MFVLQDKLEVALIAPVAYVSLTTDILKDR